MGGTIGATGTWLTGAGLTGGEEGIVGVDEGWEKVIAGCGPIGATFGLFGVCGPLGAGGCATVDGDGLLCVSKGSLDGCDGCCVSGAAGGAVVDCIGNS